jgi:phosphoglycerate dehydrogenase-like enzyme
MSSFLPTTSRDGVRLVDRDELLSQSVCRHVHARVTPETTRFIDAAASLANVAKARP